MSGAFLIAAGGTGGHIYPALALYRELEVRGRACTFVTDRRGRRFLDDRVEAAVIDAASPSGGLLRRFLAALRLARGTWQSLRLLRRKRLCAAACFGGYASVPAALAARVLRVPILVHEQNAILGRANRLIAKSARILALTFEATEAMPARPPSRVVTGNPTRPGFRSLGEEASPSNSINLLVLGGSQGARVLSDVVPQALAGLPRSLRDRLQVTQQCRQEDLLRVRAVYDEAGIDAELASFFDDVPRRMAACDLLIGRSGASTVAEVLAFRKPSVLIPYRFAADDHQRANAVHLADAGAAIVLLEDDLDAERLQHVLSGLLKDPERLRRMSEHAHRLAKPNAARDLADELIAIARRPS